MDDIRDIAQRLPEQFAYNPSDNMIDYQIPDDFTEFVIDYQYFAPLQNAVAYYADNHKTSVPEYLFDSYVNDDIVGIFADDVRGGLSD